MFYSLADGGRYYDVHKIENMRHTLTILAYEMNGAPLSVVHGAPLRPRWELFKEILPRSAQGKKAR